jgi:hypothetical protein
VKKRKNLSGIMKKVDFTSQRPQLKQRALLNALPSFEFNKASIMKNQKYDTPSKQLSSTDPLPFQSINLAPIPQPIPSNPNRFYNQSHYSLNLN